MNYQTGIELEMSSGSTITQNNVSLNKFGIYLFSSANSIVTNNTARSNVYKGIGLASSSRNRITNNTVLMNEDGIFMGSSSDNMISGNVAGLNKQAGIYLFNSNVNNVSSNELTNNFYGIYLCPCICPACDYCPGGNANNTLTANVIVNNQIGIFSNQSHSQIDSNIVCNNTESDFKSSNWLLSSGYNNTCTKPNGWNDTGTTGCTHACGLQP
jgi:parallel beta-helix repeat protein